jgi:hypothetical protein
VGRSLLVDTKSVSRLRANGAQRGETVESAHRVGRARPTVGQGTGGPQTHSGLVCDELALTDGESIGLYSPERCTIDAFRLRHLEGPEVPHEAPRGWLRRRGTQPATLLAMARSFPKAEPALRTALEMMP